MPEPLGLSNVVSVRLSAEDTIIELGTEITALKVGDTVEFIVGYSDTTVHLHEDMYAIREWICLKPCGRSVRAERAARRLTCFASGEFHLIG